MIGANRNRYTRRVVLEKSSPFVSREELCALDEELVLFKTTLPDELETDDAQLKLMCHSSEARTYVMLHSTIHLCRCDLYRFLIPGIREAVSSEAMENTPPEYIDHCQRQCLGSALSLCDLWSKLYHLQTDRDIDSPTLVIAMYQATKIIDHLCYLLPENGEHCLAVVKGKLTEAISMISYSQKASAWVRPCVSTD